MQCIKLHLEFSEEPLDDRKQKIEADLSLLVHTIFPQAEIKIKSGHGSWWISIVAVSTPVGIWLLGELGSWAISRGLDKLFDNTDNQAIPSRAEETAVETYSVAQKTASNQGMEQAMAFGAVLSEIMERTGATCVTIGEWREDIDRGILATYRATDDDKNMSFFHTNSHESFQETYTNLSNG